MGADTVFYLENYGGKTNDKNVDNTTALLSAVNACLQNGGGTIQALSGSYTFKTPVIINQPFSCIKLQGTSIWNGTNGTVFDWVGSGYFLTLNQGGQYYEIKDLYLDCHNNYGLLLNRGSQTHFKSRLKDLFIGNALRSVDIYDYAYYFLENVIVLTSNPNTERALLIESQGVSEFLYIDKCSFDGNSSCNGNAVIINKGSSIYMNGCDICNWGTGKGLSIETNSSNTIQDIFIRDLNVIRCDGGIQLKATNSAITQVIIDSPVIIFRGASSTETGIRTVRSNYYVAGLELSKLNFRVMGNVNPKYVVCLDDESADNANVEVNSNLTAGTCRIGTCYHKSTYVDRNIDIFEKTFNFTGNGKATAFNCVLSSQSPFGGGPPMILANTSLAIPFSITTGNTLGGNLFATITFSAAPPKGKAFSIYTSCGHKCRI